MGDRTGDSTGVDRRRQGAIGIGCFVRPGRPEHGARPRSGPSRFAGLAALASVGLAGCNAGGLSSAGVVGTSGAKTSPGRAAHAAAASMQRPAPAAQASALAAVRLPRSVLQGFRASGRFPLPPVGSSAAGPLRSCLGEPAAATGGAIRSTSSSADFAQQGWARQQVGAAATVFGSPAQAERMMSALRSQRAGSCLDSYVLGELSPSARAQHLTLDTTTEVTPLAKPAPGVAAYRFALVALPSPSQLSPFSIYVDVFAFRAGPAVVELCTISPYQLFAAQLEPRLLSALGRSSRAAFGSSG